MSCDASIVVVGSTDPAAALDAAVGRLFELEQRWSRFLSTSEISELNARAGQPVAVSPDTMRLVSAMVDGWHATGGDFDPTMAGSMVRLGYDRSLQDGARRTELRPDADSVGRPGEILMDLARGYVQLPVGTALDPGGIGKGLAADLVVDELIAAGAGGAVVEIGGDIRCRGRAPEAGGWRIAVDDSFDDELCQRWEVRLLDGGVATSSVRRRRWRLGEELRHHLVDPRTGDVCRTTVRSCTVIAGSAAHAEAQTKVAFVEGPQAAIDRFTGAGFAAQVELDDGQRLETPAWQQFARPAPRESAMTSPS